MDTERFYPELNLDEKQLWGLQIVRRQLDADPDYLNDTDCPYDEGTKDVLGGSSERKPAEDDPDLDLVKETERLFRELKDYGDKVDESGDASEKNTYFRVSTSLLEKLVSLREKAMGQRQAEEFINDVLRILGDELPPDLRTRVLDKLREE